MSDQKERTPADNWREASVAAIYACIIGISAMGLVMLVYRWLPDGPWYDWPKLVIVIGVGALGGIMADPLLDLLFPSGSRWWSRSSGK